MLGLYFGGVIRWPVWSIIIVCCVIYGVYISLNLSSNRTIKYLKEVK